MKKEFRTSNPLNPSNAVLDRLKTVGMIAECLFSRTNAPDSDLFLSCVNDVILAASGETKEDIAKASCVMKAGVALGSDLNVIRTEHNGIFLSYFLNSARRRAIAKVAQGDTVVHPYPSQLEQITIAIADRIGLSGRKPT